MMLGASTLAYYGLSVSDAIYKIGSLGFECAEILCDWPHSWPRELSTSEIRKILQIKKESDLELFLHAPVTGLNPASINPGFRNETKRQIMETIDLATKLDAKIVTVHPGHVPWLGVAMPELAVNFCLESFREITSYAANSKIIISIENMPRMPGIYCQTKNGLVKILNDINSPNFKVTLDVGHANLITNPSSFLSDLLNSIALVHLSDNDGQKDQHLAVGEGTIDFLPILTTLKKQDMPVMIEVQQAKDVLASKEKLEKLI